MLEACSHWIGRGLDSHFDLRRPLHGRSPGLGRLYRVGRRIPTRCVAVPRATLPGRASALEAPRSDFDAVTAEVGTVKGNLFSARVRKFPFDRMRAGVLTLHGVSRPGATPGIGLGAVRIQFAKDAWFRPASAAWAAKTRSAFEAVSRPIKEVTAWPRAIGESPRARDRHGCSNQAWPALVAYIGSPRRPAATSRLHQSCPVRFAKPATSIGTDLFRCP